MGWPLEAIDQVLDPFVTEAPIRTEAVDMAVGRARDLVNVADSECAAGLAKYDGS